MSFDVLQRTFPSSPSEGEGGSRAKLAKSSCGGPGLVRSGSQFVLPDLFGRVRLALNSSGSTVASAVFDSLGVLRHGSGTLANGVVRNTYGTGDEDGLAGFLQGRELTKGGSSKQDRLDDLIACAKKCNGKPQDELVTCIAKCLGQKERGRALDDLFCKYSPDSCVGGKPRKCGPASSETDKQDCCDHAYFKCMVTSPPFKWGECKNKHTMCYIRAEVGV